MGRIGKEFIRQGESGSFIILPIFQVAHSQNLIYPPHFALPSLPLPTSPPCHILILIIPGCPSFRVITVLLVSNQS